MPKIIDIAGMKFGRYSVLSRATGPLRKAYWNCRCDCGTHRIVLGANLRRGLTQSCGCLNADQQRERMTTHGATGSPEFRVWTGMHQRCRDPNAKGYKNYGGRGISVCQRWASFENFLHDMGPRPAGRSIDRIDVNGNYEPTNCRWATSAEQAANKRPKGDLQQSN